jgi:hypothetical protein
MLKWTGFRFSEIEAVDFRKHTLDFNVVPNAARESLAAEGQKGTSGACTEMRRWRGWRPAMDKFIENHDSFQMVSWRSVLGETQALLSCDVGERDRPV